MSGALTAGPTAPAPSGQNPLASGPQTMPAPGGGVDAPDFHAQAGQHIAGLGLSPKDMAKEVSVASYAVNEFGKLARNPDVKAKDVVKAAAQAVADGVAEPSGAIKMLSQMPADPKHLRDWLKSMYTANLTAAVHLKAMMMQAGVPIPAEKAPKAAKGAK